jgi:hypothetical protein
MKGKIMALTWDITNCKNMQEIKGDSEWFKTEYMIFATMAIDMSEITESNVGEFYARLRVISEISGGAYYTSDGGYEHPTLVDVYKRIGLHTNAWSKNTFNQWLKRMTEVHSEFSKNKMLAIYYAAKSEAEEMIEVNA